MSRALSAALMIAAAGAAPVTRAQTPDDVKIDKDRFVFGQILDNTAFQEIDSNPGEYESYAIVLGHARDHAGDRLRDAARRDVAYKDLIRNPAEYRLELVAFEGRLRQLRRTEPPKALKDAGVADLYEAWIFPLGEVTPLVVCFTELPDGLAPQKDLQKDAIDAWVVAAGYSFKIFQYESKERDAKNPGRNVFRRAPLLLGRTLHPKADPTVRDQGERWQTEFGPAVVGGVGGLGLLVVGLTWWFRRGDKPVRAAIDARRDANPFAA